MNIAYISVSFSKRKLLDNEMRIITDVLKRSSMDAFIFVDHYTFSSSQEKEMMQQALADIDRCDLLIAETSDKAIGIGIEAGYAKAKNKPVIYIRHASAEHSTTLSGISDYQIIYTDLGNLANELVPIISKVKQLRRL